MRVLSVNCGSSTLKFDVVDVNGTREPTILHRARGTVERIGGQATARLSAGARTLDSTNRATDHGEAFGIAVDLLERVDFAEGVEAVGHRVVHGGARFRGPVLVDGDVINAIESVSDLAPLHNGPALVALRAAQLRFGPQMPMVATFDTAFFASLPDVAAVYALPSKLSERLGIRRFGFHGLAHRYMVERYSVLRPGVNQPRLITLQLGNGCSATASANGSAVDTSMGFTPVEGLMMGTRSGDIDPSLPLLLAEKEDLSLKEVDSLLNNDSGLLGLSGRSNDMRDLVEASKAGHRASDLAVRAFCYRARKYVGAYLAALGGADAILFGGGIGEHLPEIRERICEGFEWAGLGIDAQLNEKASGVEMRISAVGSRLESYVIPVQEGVVIARDTYACLANPA